LTGLHKWAERADLFDDLMQAHMHEGQTQSTLHMPVVPLSCVAFDGYLLKDYGTILRRPSA